MPSIQLWLVLAILRPPRISRSHDPMDRRARCRSMLSVGGALERWPTELLRSKSAPDKSQLMYPSKRMMWFPADYPRA